MTSPRLSVILPFYNPDPVYFRESLESLVSQSLEDWTCLLVSDGSNRASLRLAERFAAGDSRFTLIRQPHRGIARALNNGLDACRTPYAARLDADDCCHPDRLKIQLSLAQSHPDNTLVSCRISMTGGMKRYESWANTVGRRMCFLDEMLVDCPLPHPTWLFNLGSFRALGGYREGPGPEDYDLFLRMCREGWRFTMSDRPLVTMRHHPERLTVKDPRYDPRSFRVLKRDYIQDCYHLDKVSIIGGGKTARAWFHLLDEREVRVERFLDIRPTRIGKIIQGTPVESMETHRFSSDLFYVAALPRLSQRDLVRGILSSHGLKERTHFICVT